MPPLALGPGAWQARCPSAALSLGGAAGWRGLGGFQVPAAVDSPVPVVPLRGPLTLSESGFYGPLPKSPTGCQAGLQQAPQICSPPYTSEEIYNGDRLRSVGEAGAKQGQRLTARPLPSTL